MTSYVPHWAWYAKPFFQNIYLIIFYNFNHDQIVVKNKSKGLKRQLSIQITKKRLNDVSKWLHMSDTGYCMQKPFSKRKNLIIFYNFNHDQLGVKTKFKGLKRQLSSKINGKWINDLSKLRHISNTVYGMQNFFYQNIPLNLFNYFN